jgi:DNA-directed RNA polymerase omega subunit
VHEKTAEIDSKFRFILIAAKRARQLQSGAKPLIHTISRKPTRIAQEEVRAGAIDWELTPLVIPAEPDKGEAAKKAKK